MLNQSTNTYFISWSSHSLPWKKHPGSVDCIWFKGQTLIKKIDFYAAEIRGTKRLMFLTDLLKATLVVWERTLCNWLIVLDGAWSFYYILTAIACKWSNIILETAIGTQGCLTGISTTIIEKSMHISLDWRFLCQTLNSVLFSMSLFFWSNSKSFYFYILI